MAGHVTWERAPLLPSPSDVLSYWYAGLCAECGWVLPWDNGPFLPRFDVNAHAKRWGHHPELIRTPGDGRHKPPTIDPPRVKVPTAKQQAYYAKCTRCEWGTKEAKTPMRAETFACRHRDATGHHVNVHRRDERTADYVAGNIESFFRGEEQVALF